MSKTSGRPFSSPNQSELVDTVANLSILRISNLDVYQQIEHKIECNRMTELNKFTGVHKARSHPFPKCDKYCEKPDNSIQGIATMTFPESMRITCRLCMEERSEMLLIFGIEGLQRQVPQKLRACLPVLVYKTDPLPKQICHFCAARLDDAYEFREHCLNVYKSMHAKLLSVKNKSETVRVFMDAMANSPDPCQVKLCSMKSRAPPPLVPLPANSMQPFGNNSQASSENEALKTNHVATIEQSLPEISCEVEIKEEAEEIYDSLLDFNSSFHEVSEKANETRSFCNNETEHNICENNKSTSILEQVLKGNLTLNEHHKEFKGKSGLSTQWWCAPCNNYYRNRESLVKHMQVFCPRRYTCRKCCRVFHTVKDLAVHEGTEHLKITIDDDECFYKCHQCDREFVSWEMLRHHRLREHVAESIEIGVNTWCPICNRFFTDMDSYEKHQELHQPEEPYNNVPPMVVVPILPQLEINQRKEYNDVVKSLACPTCGKVCTQQSALSNHMRTHEPKRYKCDVCGRSFGLYVRLTTHKITEHNQVPKNSIESCVEQEDALNEEREAREAREARTRVRSRTAAQMENENEFNGEQSPPAKRSSLPAKVLSAHSDGQVKSFACKTCKKSFSQRWLLTRHEGSHRRSMASTYTCSICNQVFLEQAMYKAHQAAHSVERTYHCPKCNKLFFKEVSLMSHKCSGKTLPEKTADGNVPKTLPNAPQQQITKEKYKCSKCNIIFDSHQSRNSHMRVHSEAFVLKKQIEMQKKSESLKLKTAAGTSTISREEDKNEMSMQDNVPPPVKRTLIRTSGGYRCGVCQSPFVLRELAVAHLRSAHPVYQCPYCKKRFTTQHIFTHHVKTNHPNESEK